MIVYIIVNITSLARQTRMRARLHVYNDIS